MYKYAFWPGAYSLKNEISLFLLSFIDEIEKVLKVMEK